MTDRNYEKNYYISRDGEKINYDPKTKQPPVVYGEGPFTEADLNELEQIDTDGFIIHESHGEYEPYTPTTVDSGFDVSAINGYERDVTKDPLYKSDLAPENGKFHIRYYGVVEHSQFAPCDPSRGGDIQHSGLVSLAVRGMGDNHLHTDLHTFHPLSLLAEGNCPPGSKVRVDIQDFENVILDYIYNYPEQLFVEDYDGDPEEFTVQTMVELGQWDGNKKMRLVDFFQVLAKRFGTSIGDLYETMAQYDKDHKWIVDAPTQLGMTLDHTDGVCLPYSQLPAPALKGDFEYNPATHIGTLMFNYVDYIIIPPRDEKRIFQMVSPQIMKAGTIPAAVRPKQNTILTSYADVTVRTGSTEVIDEDRDHIDLELRTDGSVWVTGNFWLQHHEVGKPGVKENDRWRIEIASRSGAIFL